MNRIVLCAALMTSGCVFSTPPACSDDKMPAISADCGGPGTGGDRTPVVNHGGPGAGGDRVPAGQ
jgi:hypothetical protein